MTQEEKNNLTKNITSYLSIPDMPPGHVKELTKDIAEGEEARRSSSYLAILKLFKEFDVEVKQ